MPAKRARDGDSASEAGSAAASEDGRKSKKAKHGFRVGPENLPDGPWRRKVAKIKKELITKAKVKKQYAKIKAEHQKQQAATPSKPTEDQNQSGALESGRSPASTPAPAQIHPERQAMLESFSSSKQQPPAARSSFSETNPTTPQKEPQQQDQQQDQDQDHQQPPRGGQQQQQHRRRQRPDYFRKELAAAERARQQAEARAAEAARREEERQRRRAERERYRRAMAKAKTPGRDGKPKLGRESKLLLERVRKMMGEGG
ncbi:99fb88df-19d3-4bef-9321-002f70935c46 [Thermothielavioides terrestris]|uniref:rRNA-processing protein FYV7 n=2 Tax=Thermothielavioides terrestris TaxID=2587410 RepID=G2R3I8_THETT|nr:uncharacterized protein THITE_2170396 [Thermothielavioides terrestris NRRL 8126]AEO66798.1 hypothetical protein THITE_2170396 [Thermothielavioides terrestris NRRL 8126]SPQ19977.1 99fb88df-19d3-4bef-9321-002f70935c46 [Thermothielavioides terrestris]